MSNAVDSRVVGPPRWRRVLWRASATVAVLVFVAVVLAAVGFYFSFRKWGEGMSENAGRPMTQAEIQAQTFDTKLQAALATGPVAPRQLSSTGITVQAVTAEPYGAGRVYYRSTGALRGDRQTLCLVDVVDLKAAIPTVDQQDWSCNDELPGNRVEVLRPRR